MRWVERQHVVKTNMNINALIIKQTNKQIEIYYACINLLLCIGVV